MPLSGQFSKQINHRTYRSAIIFLVPKIRRAHAAFTPKCWVLMAKPGFEWQFSICAHPRLPLNVESELKRDLGSIEVLLKELQ